MKIVVTTPILYDKKSPFNHLFKDILEGWMNAGHEIVRIVACDNIASDDYKLGITSDRISYIPIKRKNAKKTNIIARYLTDSWTNMRMARKIRKINDADVLFEDVSYSSYWSVRAAKKKKMRVVSMLQDVWPDNAVASGLFGDDGLIYKFFEGFQKKVYKKSNTIICISDTMKDFIASKGIAKEKIQVIYNWGYGDEAPAIPCDENRFRLENGFGWDKFYVVYAGNIGRMQNVELLVGAAELLKDNEKIQFLIVGDGANKEKIDRLVKDKALTNVTLMPMQPSSMAEHIYSMADINIIPLVEKGIRTALPSKTGVVLSCGKPVLFCFGESGSFEQKLKGYEGVENLSATDKEELASRILYYANKGAVACDSIKLFMQDFTRTKNISKYVKSVE